MDQRIEGRLVTPMRGRFESLGQHRVADPFYEKINPDRLTTYQRYLDALFMVIDVDNYTRWASRQNYDRDKLSKQDRLMKRLFREDASSRGLSPDYLHTMINQYFFADPELRKRYKGSWAETVVYRRRTKSFFLNGISVRSKLDDGGKSEGQN
ncbi:MAG: hypothetical protein OEO83_09115 [Alphaproteobacteria bacterium]|nr:hypothetical protein [Alphaproteobacteria bacterium]